MTEKVASTGGVCQAAASKGGPLNDNGAPKKWGNIFVCGASESEYDLGNSQHTKWVGCFGRL